ncbi:MAG: hypothetical protein PHN69_00560 [Candidatus Pacebacteria bacterium]|nr:hypothetical protein [Candidatus Paceibacterota bacterium]
MHYTYAYKNTCFKRMVKEKQDFSGYSLVFITNDNTLPFFLFYKRKQVSSPTIRRALSLSIYN